MGVDVTYAVTVPQTGNEDWREARRAIGQEFVTCPSITATDLTLPRDLRDGAWPLPPATTGLLTLQSSARFIDPLGPKESQRWGYWPMVRAEMEAILELTASHPCSDAWYLPDDAPLECVNDLVLAASRGNAHLVASSLVESMDDAFRTSGA